MPTLPEKVLGYIRGHALLRAGQRVGVAVSGGADSVALLRLLLELRTELGLVPAVVHFNNRIRGAEADADEQFVRSLAERFDLFCHVGSADVPAHARNTGISLETAARDLRYGYFRDLCVSLPLDKIAVAHSQDDQAETVLLRLVRGAGTRGLAGIYPALPLGDGGSGVGLVRPLLAVTRRELEEYLKSLDQEWREDASNRDLRHSRNRIRHTLLPMLEREFNPAIRQVLAETAEIAREEESYWKAQVEAALAQVMHSGGPGEVHLRIAALAQLPPALQRRLVRQSIASEALDFQHVEQVLALVESGSGAEVELPGQWRVCRTPRCPKSAGGSAHPKADPELVFSPRAGAETETYEYVLPVPGEVYIQEIGIRLRASVLSAGNALRGECGLLDVRAAGACLRVRNWRAGDRYWPRHTGSPKKVKELLQARRVSGRTRAMWPVAVNAEAELVWMKDFPLPERFLAGEQDAAVLIETQ